MVKVRTTSHPSASAPDVPQSPLGQRIRRLRVQQGQTQGEVACACGFTKSLLSKIETGRVFPPIATLVKIAGTLGTNLAALLEDDNKGGADFCSLCDALRSMAPTEKGYSVFPFAVSRSEKKMQPFLFEVRKGEVKHHSLSHTGEEFLYVLEGEIQFRVGNIEYGMRAGDSLYFDATEEHGVKAVSEVARYLDVFC